MKDEKLKITDLDNVAGGDFTYEGLKELLESGELTEAEKLIVIQKLKKLRAKGSLDVADLDAIAGGNSEEREVKSEADERLFLEKKAKEIRKEKILD